MPVDFEQYDSDQGRIDLTEGTNARELLLVLLKHRGVGFTPGELHEKTSVPKGSINPTLARLERAGLVRHKEPYWATAEDDRLAAASTAVLGLETAAETFAGDWYDQNPDWAADLPDLSESESKDEDVDE